MAVPTFVGFGVNYSASGSLISCTPAAGTTDGDIIVDYLMSKYVYPDVPGTISASTNGGAKIYQGGAGGFLSLAVFWQRVSGSAPASVNYLHAVSSLPLGIVSTTFRGCVSSGTPYDFYTAESPAVSSTWNISSGTTLGDDRRIVTGYITDAAGNSFSAGTYFSVDAQGDIGTGFYGALLGYADLLAGSSPSDSGGMFSSQRRRGLTLALIPGASGYANKVNGVAAASIGKVNGVATASISEVNGA